METRSTQAYGVFLRQARECWDLVAAAAQRKVPVAAGDLGRLHQIKGAAGFFAAPDLEQAARALESHLAQGLSADDDKVSADLVAFSAALVELETANGLP